MIKVYLCVGFSILFFLFYVFSFLLYQSDDYDRKTKSSPLSAFTQ